MVTVFSLRWILFCQLIIDLRSRAANQPGASGLQTEDMSKFQATMVFMRNALTRDLDEPLYPLPHHLDGEGYEEREAVGSAEGEVEGHEEG
jgi:hypothetical protein